MFRYSPCLLPSLVLAMAAIATTSTAQWSTNYWPATNSWWIRSAHVEELHAAINERYLAALGSNWPDQVTNAAWITRGVVSNAANTLRTLAPYYVDQTQTNAAGGQYTSTTTNDFPKWTWTGMVNDVTGTNEITGTTNAAEVVVPGYWIKAATFDELKAICNTMVWLRITGTAPGADTPDTNLTGEAEAVISGICTNPYPLAWWDATNWPARTAIESGGNSSAVWSQNIAGVTQRIYRRTVVSESFDGVAPNYVDCGVPAKYGTPFLITTGIDVAAWCDIQVDGTNCTESPDAWTVTNFTLLDSETNACLFASQIASYTNDANWNAGAGSACSTTPWDFDIKRDSHAMLYTIPAGTNYGADATEYFLGGTNILYHWIAETNIVTGTLASNIFQAYLAESNTAFPATNIITTNFVTDDLPYQDGPRDTPGITNGQAWEASSARLLLKYDATNGFLYLP